MISGSDIVQCFPIDTYLQALNIKEINYFSLDVEGAEYEILKQIDFHRIKIDLMTIEYPTTWHRFHAESNMVEVEGRGHSIDIVI